MKISIEELQAQWRKAMAEGNTERMSILTARIERLQRVRRATSSARMRVAKIIGSKS